MSKKKPKKQKAPAAVSHISELEEFHDSIRQLAPTPPFPGMFEVDAMTGNFIAYHPDMIELVPEEALRVGQFLVDFYGPK
jgi:hypothetical protein